MVDNLVVEGNHQNNLLSIDILAIPAGGLEYHGNGDGDFDTLILLNAGSNASTLNHQFANSHDGQVTIAGKSIRYTGLEPIVDSIVAADRSFTFADSDDDVTLANSGTLTDGILQITSVASSESVEFVSATASLQVDLGEGDNRLTIGALDNTLTVPITVVMGSGLDILQSASGDLDMTNRKLQKSGGLLTISSPVAGSNFTASGDFAIELLSGGRLTQAMTFGNTAGVTLGGSTNSSFDFVSGLTSTASVTNVQGTVRAQDASLVFGSLNLLDDTTFTAKTVRLEHVTGSGDLTINGNVVLGGAIEIDGTLTINGTLTLTDDAILSLSGSSVMNSTIAGSFSLVKAGDGTLRIVQHGFSGSLTIEDGSVELPAGLAEQSTCKVAV